jgi:hypothetical protein
MLRLVSMQSTRRRVHDRLGSHCLSGSSAPQPAAGEVPSTTMERVEAEAAAATLRQRRAGAWRMTHASSSSVPASASASADGRLELSAFNAENCRSSPRSERCVGAIRGAHTGAIRGVIRLYRIAHGEPAATAVACTRDATKRGSTVLGLAMNNKL